MNKEYFVDKLRVVVSETRDEMGTIAASDAAKYMRQRIADKKNITAIFAAAPSQNEVLEHVCREDVDWTKVTAYHMDEYVGLALDAPERFARYLDTHVFSKVKFSGVNYLAGDDGKLNPVYSDMFSHNRADICFMGIGENGHIAFNDPPVADLFDTYFAKEVMLDDVCRMQQVHDGCFESFDKVPEKAITLTVPTLLRTGKLICVVPGPTKAKAVYDMLNGPIGTDCPASSLRLHPDATLYIDADAAALLK